MSYIQDDGKIRVNDIDLQVKVLYSENKHIPDINSIQQRKKIKECP